MYFSDIKTDKNFKFFSRVIRKDEIIVFYLIPIGIKKITIPTKLKNNPAILIIDGIYVIRKYNPNIIDNKPNKCTNILIKLFLHACLILLYIIASNHATNPSNPITIGI